MRVSKYQAVAIATVLYINVNYVTELNYNNMV